MKKIIILVVLLLVVGGWFLYKSSTDYSTDSQSSFFQIKEVGIQFRSSGDIEDLIYSISDTDGIKVISFSTKRLTDLSVLCAPNQIAGLGTLTINSKKQYETTYGGNDGYPLIKLDDKYIVYINPTREPSDMPVCATDSQAKSLQDTQVTSFKESIKTLSLIKN